MATLLARESTSPRPRKLAPRAGIRAHRTVLPADEIAEVAGIPTTSAPRTQFDLAGVLHRHELERAVEQAGVLHLWDRLSLADLLERYPGHRGTATLRVLIEGARIRHRITRSDLERRFLPLVEGAGLPLPESNAQVDGVARSWEGDCVWPAQRLVVELDSRTFHDTEAAFERDRERDRRLAATGWPTLRVIWKQLVDDPSGVLDDIASVLARSMAA